MNNDQSAGLGLSVEELGSKWGAMIAPTLGQIINLEKQYTQLRAEYDYLLKENEILREQLEAEKSNDLQLAPEVIGKLREQAKKLQGVNDEA